MTNWKCTIPDGEIGEAKLETFDVGGLQMRLANMRGARLVEGEYKRLFVGGRLMMSDTPKERCDHFPLFSNACGHVLINGLGMGCCLSVVQSMGGVLSVIVIEQSQDVINLIGPHFPNVNIICADAFEWKSPVGVRYGAVWHDIWPDICTDNLVEMHKLHRRYGRKSDWQGSWSRDELEYNKQRYA